MGSEGGNWTMQKNVHTKISLSVSDKDLHHIMCIRINYSASSTVANSADSY
jgi:hypothetical protein